MTHVRFNNRPVKTFDNIFEELFNGYPTHWNNNNNNNNKGSNVPVNIHEAKDGFHLEFNAAGRNKEEFKVEVDKGLLTVSFEAKDAKAATENKEGNENNQPEAEYKTVRREFTLGSFKRSFNVDDKVDADNIQAKYENGILKVYLPKKEVVVVTGKQINVQ